MKAPKIWLIVFLVPSILIVASIFFIPMMQVIYYSFTNKHWADTYRFTGFANYKTLFTNNIDFVVSLKNTVIWVVLQSTIHVMIGLSVALILRRKLIGWKLVRTAFMVPNIVMPTVVGFLFLQMLNPSYGIVNQMIRAIGFKNFELNWYFDTSSAFYAVTFTWIFYAGFIMILCLSEIFSISPELIESAKLDGATDIQTDRYIVIPMLRNIIGTATILAATGMLQQFDLIYMTTRGGPGNITINLPLFIYRTAALENNTGLGSAVGVIQLALGVIVIIAITKMFRLGKSDI